jgi:hypothetical protein
MHLPKKAENATRMQPAKPCKNNEILKARLRADLKVYADAVATLESNVGKQFEKIHQKAEHAKLAYKAARERLHEHLASHGCA